MRKSKIYFAIILILAISSVRTQAENQDPQLMKMNAIAEDYVRLVLALGEHDPDYVDAYYGPPEWRTEVKSQKKTLEQIKQGASTQFELLGKISVHTNDELVQLRHRYLIKQLQALLARTEMLAGKKFSFDEETKALYDAEAPEYAEKHFESILAEIDKLVPGQGDLTERYTRFRSDFIIPKEKLDPVFSAAINECRNRTKEHIRLPSTEDFRVEYVTNKAWSAYNWYQGNFQSLIQVNTELPIYLDRVIDLACHEGYPGHHVYNALLEDRLVKARAWMEYTVYPLFSPQSLIAEGTANYGIEVAFPGNERITFEKEALAPLAGLDPQRIEVFYKIHELVVQLDYAGNEAARRYLNGKMDRDQAAAFLTKYGLMAPERAKQRVRFIDQYRSYVINYNLGQDLVRKYIESRGGTKDHPDIRWREFEKLISSPRLPSDLKP